MEIERNILKEYEELTNEEKQRVDEIVDKYNNGKLNCDSFMMKSSVYDDEGECVGSTYVNMSGNDNITGDDVEAYMKKFASHAAKINEALDKKDLSHNEEQNKLRQQLFQDRLQNGFYNNMNPNMQPQAPVNINVSNNANTDEVKQLKNEISDLKNEMSEMMSLLKEKLK